MGHNPSYAWQGLWEAKKWVLKGCRWRIGDGRRVRVWRDHWIPGERQVATPLDTLGLNIEQATVDKLIDQNTMSWNLQNIHGLFNPLVAATILKMPLSFTSYPDKCIWNEEKDGRFSVRSAYRLIQGGPLENSGECSTPSSYTLLEKTMEAICTPQNSFFCMESM